ncbi:hypothetical protein Q8A67_015581 [Cirrhinus molitorella]|uniref:Immunoglobulin domain-containing protein n=1 Tax=Cirrhinus molitorella TaxID=172907 RepID=A0AA88PM22_9TELE|nr:hypothetical protein Q8A67_015581 [Cirrhinus molitorella]
MSSFKLILLVSISTHYLMCAATVNVSVRQEQNITLSCYLNSSSEMAWYRLSSEKITLLISAAKGKLQKKDFITYYNKDNSHFQLEADGMLDSVSLAITGVRESDLGLYYCALGVGLKTMHFGPALRLTFADAEQQHSSSSVGCRTLLVLPGSLASAVRKKTQMSRQHKYSMPVSGSLGGPELRLLLQPM